MKITEFSIQGPKLIELKKFGDARGFFTERFKRSSFLEAGLPVDFPQDNFSRSLPGVLRGLHAQNDPPQGKLVTCISGRIFDVAVDIRKGSPTFGQSVSVELSGDEPAWFWIPSGFLHGFCVLGEQAADVLYKIDNEYNGRSEFGIRWNDPDLKIAWPLKDPVLSEKDKVAQSFQNYLTKKSN